MRVGKIALTTLFTIALATGCGSARKSEAPHVSIVKASYATDISNPQKLAGLADEVFVGRVTSHTGSATRDESLPENQFDVDVLLAVKGTVGGHLVVNQQGGLNAKANELVLFEDDTLIEPGNVYLFATRRNDERNWHTAVPVYGDHKLEGNLTNLSKVPEVATMKAAAKNPVKFSPGG